MTVSGAAMASLPWWSQAWPFLLVCFIPLLLVEQDIRKESGGKFAVLPFAFGFFFLWNLLVTWWLARIHFAGGMTVIILNAAVMSAVFLLFSAVRKTTGGGVAVFVILWTAFEFLHHRGDLSWPWLSLGNGLAGNARIIQWYEYTGMTGGSLWVLMVNAMLFTGITGYPRFTRRRRAILIGTLVPATVILPLAVSLYQYNNYDIREGGPEKKSFLVLQPVIDPYAGNSGGISNMHRLEQLLGMAAEETGPDIDIIITPETSVDSVWIDDPGDAIILRISEFMNLYNPAIIIAGATTFHHVPPAGKSVTTRQDKHGRHYEVQNSALYFLSGKLQEAYHKYYLANGVEQVPFGRLSGALERLTVDLGGVSGSLKPGEGASVFSPVSDQYGEYPVLGTLICFESSYGEYAGQMVGKGAEILLVISNDGWFKNTGAYRQHLRMSVIRAVETRRDIVRSANAGVSCHISGRGDITARLDWWQEGALIVHPAANDKMTFFVRSGDYTGRAALFFAFLVILNFIVRRFSGVIR
jgi:apolipoprotein N-acyltransferase